MSTELQQLPIGVFDSGVGGLTVLSAIHQLLPNEDLVYLGDTARVPYGTKSPDSVRRYAAQAANGLISSNVKAIVIACNTASAVSLDLLQQQHPDIPIIGVVEPGAEVGCKSSKTGHLAVIATESTIQGGAYQHAIARIRPEAKVISKPCSLFVSLAEEGWTEGELVEQIIATYLDEVTGSSAQHDLSIDTLVLGCTHFPVLKRAIANVIGDDVNLVDSATTTAESLKSYLCYHGLDNQSNTSGEIRFLVTDGKERFSRVAATFFGHKVDISSVELVDI